MDKYLVTYEYKKSDGCWVHTKTKSEVLTLEELDKKTKSDGYYDNYIKVLFCQKL